MHKAPPWPYVVPHGAARSLTLRFQIEDAAMLGNIFSRLAHPAQIAPMLRAYQDLRLPRTAETQFSSRLNQKARGHAARPRPHLAHTFAQIFHLPDGPAQEARDAEMRNAMLTPDQGAFAGNQNQWADRIKNDWQFGCARFSVVQVSC